jgi:hypothetical protein
MAELLKLTKPDQWKIDLHEEIISLEVEVTAVDSAVEEVVVVDTNPFF